MKSLLLFGGLLASVLLVSCDNGSDAGSEPDADATSVVVPATEYESWTYLNLADQKQTELTIESREGAVTGSYTGTASYSLMGLSGVQEDVVLVITQLGGDEVKVEVTGLNVSMSGEPSYVNLYAVSLASNDGTKWVLSAADATVNTVENADGSTTDYKLKITGSVGLTKGSEVKLTMEVTPGNMPFAIPYTYMSEVTNSFIYELDDSAVDAWDLAFHKYDIRTNGGAVAMVSAATLADVTEIPAQSDFNEDVEGSVMCDMSNMMTGSVGYHHTTLNDVLYHWVKRTETGSMPPVLYELNTGVVFVVRTNSGEYYKVRFTDHTNEKGQATYAALSYSKM